MKVENQTRGTLLGDRITVADSSMSRLFGLIPKRGLDAGEGLWIKPSSGVHTFWMRFSIDVIGLDKDLHVVKVWRHLSPFRVTSVSTKIKSVVELPVGVIQASNVQVGDVLNFS